ncbi:class I adenylate-forming enzyme family protein [Trueperella sp. LYQ143]|uniref:class I adenylate-forming enzyme family protein n=1 Tax=Trueperella sp. LYQ143 TaxID=3391059 RepID=UPI0039831DAA
MSKKPIFNAAHALDRAAHAHPQRIAIHYGSREISVREAAITSRKIAQLLASVGVCQGDRVMLISHNSPYHMLLHAGCARLGAVFVPISYRLTRSDHQRIIDFCAPRVVILEAELADGGPFESSGTLMHFVIDDDEQSPATAQAIAAGFYSWSAAIEAHTGRFITIDPAGASALNSRNYPEGPAVIFLTSGSAGVHKAVELSHEHLWWASRNFREGFEYSSRDTIAVAAPMTHIGGFNGATLDLFSHGGTLVICREFDPPALVESLARHRVSVMFGVPTMWRELLQIPEFDRAHLPVFRLALLGGAPVPAPLLQELARRGFEPLTVWGMTEIAASGTYLPAEYLPDYAGSIGRPFAHIEAKVVDDTGELSSEGELWVRGPSVVGSYWHNDEASAAHFSGSWLHTGDLVRVDEAGMMWVTGRISNVIISGGIKINAEEIQEVLLAMPGVRDCVVLGVPDERWGETVAAVFVMKTGSAIASLAEVQEYALRSLARYKVPRVMMVVDNFPTNSGGKPDRQQIRRMFAELSAENEQSLQ